MNVAFLYDRLLSLSGAWSQLTGTADPSAPELYFGYFVFLFFTPLYLVLLGVKSAMVDFKGWLLPRIAQRTGATINCVCTLILAGFLPGWIMSFILHRWYPEVPVGRQLLLSFVFVLVLAFLYWSVLVRNMKGLAAALGHGYWHAVPVGGFWLCFYIGVFLYSGQALLLALLYLLAPLGGILILPFSTAVQGTGAKPDPASLPRCVLCSEPVELAPVRCAKCDADYHPECWQHGEGCARKPCRSGDGPSVGRG